MVKINFTIGTSAVLLSILLVCWSGCYIGYGEENQEREWKSVASGYVTFGNFTMNKLEAVYVEGGEDIFHLSLQIIVTDYNGTLLLKTFDPQQWSQKYYPLDSKKKDGFYLIENLPLRPEGDISKYPYDEKIASITLEMINDTIHKNVNFSEINKSYSTDRWHVHIRGYPNKLEFIFSRVREKETFEILFYLGLITLGLNFSAALLYYISRKDLLQQKVDPSRKMGYLERITSFLSNPSLWFYLGNVVGISFYLSSILNYIIYVIPSGAFDTFCMNVLKGIMIISISFGAWSFVYKEKDKHISH